MNNDFKIYRDNIDADVRSLHGQVNQMSKAGDIRGSTQGLLVKAKEDRTSVPGVNDFASRLGTVQEVFINQLPHGFGEPFETPTLKSVSEKMDGIKPGLESNNDLFGRLKEMLFGKEKGKDTGPSLNR